MTFLRISGTQMANHVPIAAIIIIATRGTNWGLRYFIRRTTVPLKSWALSIFSGTSGPPTPRRCLN